MFYAQTPSRSSALSPDHRDDFLHRTGKTLKHALASARLSMLMERGHKYRLVSRYPTPYPEVLCTNFYALLEKLSQISGKLLPLRRRRRNWKSEWDEKVQRFNNVQRKLSSKMEELHQRLENFISESLDIEKIYSETDAKNYYSRLYSPRGLSYWPCFYQGSSTWSAS